MPPHAENPPKALSEMVNEDFYEQEICASKDESNNKTHDDFKLKIVWRNVLMFSFFHLAALYGVYLSITSAKWATVIFAYALYRITAYATTTGVHRLWAHRSYKATWQLRLILMIFQTMAFQDPIYIWCRDHRVHHKYSETDADPHNPTRGLFYAHIGWLLCKKHPLVLEKGKKIDLSDLTNDPIVAFQKKYYLIMMPILCFVIPTVIPVYLWNETWWNAYFIPTMLRYVLVLNVTWLINSVAHRFGPKPYDKHIGPAENKFVALVSVGEGYHNYHHAFPWDYRTSEENALFNHTTRIIDFFAKIGWAYDLKSATPDMIKRRVLRTGDGSHEIWGWGDSDQSEAEKREAKIDYAKAKN